MLCLMFAVNITSITPEVMHMTNRRLQMAGLMLLTISLAGCASNAAQVQQEAGAKNVRGMCNVEFTTVNQGQRAVRLVRDPGKDSGFVGGPFPADIKLWVTAPIVGTKLITLHATAQDDAIAIPVERITAVAVQSCEVIDDQDPGASQRVLTTSN
jgi:hypothetical protein